MWENIQDKMNEWLTQNSSTCLSVNYIINDATACNESYIIVVLQYVRVKYI